ncbi:hypothetical protein KAR91_50110 [Candidatus Pacearchaeota archaeon]|nr:hypothetical protein [Candidatus Pacearchaeota archaeon]
MDSDQIAKIGKVFKPDYEWMKNLPNKRTLINPLLDVREDEREKDELTEFYKLCNPFYSPAFGIKYLMGVKLFPFQMSMIITMLRHKLPLLLLTRGGGKTFILACYALYHAIMFPYSRIILVSASFRQSRLIFQEMEKMVKQWPLLHQMLDREPVHNQDHWKMEICGSSITALPMGDGKKIRGERGHVIIADEFNCCHKCLVETDIGLFKIDDLINNFVPGDKPVPVLTGDDSLPIENPDKYIITPEPVDVYKVATTHGYGFECSKKHQVMTIDGWKLAKDLDTSDYLLLESSDYFPKDRIKTDCIEVNKDIAWLMGYLVAEGAINSKHTISCCSIDRKPIDKMAKILNKYTNNKITIHERAAHIDHRGWNCQKRYDLTLCDIKLRSRLENLGLDKVKSHGKLIPWSILRSPQDIMISFLAGIFEGDGSAFVFKDRSMDNCLGVAYYSVNEELCEQIQTILLKFGIICNKRIRPGAKNPQCMLRSAGRDAINLFKLLNISKWSEKIDIDKVYVPTSRKSGHVHERKSGRYTATVNNASKDNNLGTFDTKKQAKRVCEKYIKNMPRYVKVKYVKLLPEKETLYDFHLPKTHSFLANGFRQHNSIPIEIFDVVVRGFAATQLDPWEKVKSRVVGGEEEERSDDISSGNKIILAGTAGYTGETLHGIYSQYGKIIGNNVKGDTSAYADLFDQDEMRDGFEVNCDNYAIIRYPWETIPEGMMEREIIEANRANMPKQLFDMEYNTIFGDDSLGFFKAKQIRQATAKPPNGFSVLTHGKANREYVMGVDPAKQIDRFAVTIIERGSPHKVVYQWTAQKKKYSECAAHMRELCRRFNIVAICIDAGGGGLAVEEMVNMEKTEDGIEIRKPNEPKFYRFDDEREEAKDGIPLLHLQSFSSNWLDESNTLLQKNIEDSSTMFPVTISKSALDEEEEDILFEINELKKELSSITIIYTKTGKKSFDLKPHDERKEEGVKHKDRYSSFLLCNYIAMRLEEINYDDMEAMRRKYDDDDAEGGWIDEFN